MKKAWAFFALLAVCVLPAAAQSNLRSWTTCWKALA